MNDPVIVGRFERFRDLPGDRPRFIEWKRALDETVRQSDPVDQFEDQRTRALRFLEPVDGCNVGMIECRENLRFSSEPRQALGIERDGVGQHLQRDVAAEIRIAGAVDLAHAACTEQGQHLVRAKPEPWPQRHLVVSVSSSGRYGPPKAAPCVARGRAQCTAVTPANRSYAQRAPSARFVCTEELKRVPRSAARVTWWHRSSTRSCTRLWPG